MKVVFKRTINDARERGKAFFAGKEYDLPKERVRAILKAFPTAIETVEAERKPAKKKAKKVEAIEVTETVEVATPDIEPIAEV